MASAINIAFPLTRGTDGAFQTNSDTLSAVGSDLRILLITNHGERPCNYRFGANLRSLLFQNEGPQLVQAVKDAIQAAVDEWMPFVTIKSINVLTEADDSTIRSNQIKVTIEFTVGALPITSTIIQTVG